MLLFLLSDREVRYAWYVVHRLLLLLVVGCNSDRGPFELAELWSLISVRQRFQFITSAFVKWRHFSIVLNCQERYIVRIETCSEDLSALSKHTVLSDMILNRLYLLVSLREYPRRLLHGGLAQTASLTEWLDRI